MVYVATFVPKSFLGFNINSNHCFFFPLSSFITSIFPPVNWNFVIFRYDKEVFGISVDGKEYMIKLIDTAGQEEYERVRKLFYKEADCFIICYDVSNRTSYTNVIEKWIPELKTIENWPIPIVLVGNK